MVRLESLEPAALDVPGVSGWTTTRETGSFGFGSSESVKTVFDRWTALQTALRERGLSRLACASQVHGATIATHHGDWHGWLRLPDVDGHVTMTRGTAMAVTIADCTPVFIAHPDGAAAVLHAGWRGTAANILEAGLEQLAQLGFAPHRAHVHLGPSICERCYEVGPEVLTAIHGHPHKGKGFLDVRAVLARQAVALGVAEVTTTPMCTRHNNDRFFSHRAGDEGRQLGVIGLLPV